MIRFTCYGVIAEKPRVGQLGRIFPCTLYEKLCVGSKNGCHIFWCARRALSPCKVWVLLLVFVLRSYYARRLYLRKCDVCFFVTGRLPFTLRQWPKIRIFANARKTVRWIEKWLTPFRIVTTFSISMQNLGGDRTTRAGCRSENCCFLYVTLGLPARGGT